MKVRAEISKTVFRAAAYFSDPSCKSHEYFRRMQLIEVLNPLEDKISHLARGLFLSLALVSYAFVGTFMAFPGVGLRAFGSFLQNEPFLFLRGNTSTKTLPQERSFSLLSWNICCVGGGYPISDGGVMPWVDRIDALALKILETDADVNCLYETFDTKAAFILYEKLSTKGYSHFYFNIGPKAVGVSSGIFVASKYGIRNPEFTPFSQEMLVGRTKNASKGIFSFDLESQGSCFAKVITTHLQHSEEPAFPTKEERDARSQQMEMLAVKALSIKDRSVIVTGDLNLDDEEYRASAWSGFFEKGDLFSEKTWGGDAFCALLTKKRISHALNLDHTMALKDTIHSIATDLIETGYVAQLFKKEALSDHRGLLSIIGVK